MFTGQLSQILCINLKFQILTLILMAVKLDGEEADVHLLFQEESVSMELVGYVYLYNGQSFMYVHSCCPCT